MRARLLDGVLLLLSDTTVRHGTKPADARVQRAAGAGQAAKALVDVCPNPNRGRRRRGRPRRIPERSHSPLGDHGRMRAPPRRAAEWIGRAISRVTRYSSFRERRTAREGAHNSSSHASTEKPAWAAKERALTGWQAFAELPPSRCERYKSSGDAAEAAAVDAPRQRFDHRAVAWASSAPAGSATAAARGPNP